MYRNEENSVAKKERRISAGTAALLVVASLLFGCAGSENRSRDTVRFGLFNIWEMSTTKLTDVDTDGVGRDAQLKAAAEIIRTVRPDVLVLNEIDHDIDAVGAGRSLTRNARRFNDAYLNRESEPLDYPFVYAAPCNTGFTSGWDLDNNGVVSGEENSGSPGYGGDCHGFGNYPGQYSMAILSRYPLQSECARTFQKFLWKDIPDHMIPAGWYSDDEIETLRLSSKSHWDIPVTIGKTSIHLLLSHPTPPIFDSEEDRNGRRNYDELRMWAHYISDDSVMVDDTGRRGGLPARESFIIAGDLNASPRRASWGDGPPAINQLLNHGRVNGCRELFVSEGALHGREPGPPEYFERRTAGWAARGICIDYIIPSKDLEPVSGGVFWPDTLTDPAGAALAQKASDHRMIWVDIELK